MKKETQLKSFIPSLMGRIKRVKFNSQNGFYLLVLAGSYSCGGGGGSSDDNGGKLCYNRYE